MPQLEQFAWNSGAPSGVSRLILRLRSPHVCGEPRKASRPNGFHRQYGGQSHLDASATTLIGLASIWRQENEDGDEQSTNEQSAVEPTQKSNPRPWRACA